MPDSITHSLDNLSQLRPDSLNALDSLSALDSLNNAITLPLQDSTTTPAVQVINGMEGLIPLSNPGNESWVFILIVALFVFLTSGLALSAGTFSANFKSFFSRKENSNLFVYPTANIFQFHVLIAVFTIAVFALFGYQLAFNMPAKFSFQTYLQFCAAVAGFFLLKNILFDIVGNTFFGQKITRGYKVLYFNLVNALAILIFPITILYSYQPASWQIPLIYTAFSLFVIFHILLIIKLFQNFFTKFIALFYIFLYLCTLEILPILLLVRVSQKFIQIV